MISRSQINSFADVLIKTYGKDKAIKRCSNYISTYEKKVEDIPKCLNERFASQIMLEFYKDVYLHLNLI